MLFRRKLHLFIGFLLLSMVVSAQSKEQVLSTPMFGSLGQLAVDSSVVTMDSIFYDASYNTKLVKPYPVKNRLVLKLDASRHKVLPARFTASVKLGVSYLKADNSAVNFDKVLSLQYVGDSIFTSENQFVFEGGYKVTVTVKELNTDASASIWNELMVVSEVRPSRLFNFSCTDDKVSVIALESLSSTTTSDEIGVSWPMVIGADAYDLEWTYLDTSAINSGAYSTSGQPDPKKVFENNSSRVTVAGVSYRIPLIYDSKGVLYVRVRPVQYLPNGGRREGDWNPSPLANFAYDGHEVDLNWQASTSFAEEGKRKSVVQYFDGSLRMRQAVTKDNDNQHTIVSESIYDAQGRPVIQVLPAPTLNNTIKYTKNFNQSALNSNGYDYTNFDSLATGEQYCDKQPEAMGTASGAAQYYSPSNPSVNDGKNQYIPNANGFPFTQVEYTPDQTGRVNKQSGVGQDFKMGSGHETQYFYGTPSQEELNALFGTEAGVNSHYFKTMVRDANGQFSVSYQDMNGKTVATALAGELPNTTKLDYLSSNTGRTITEKLASPENTVVRNFEMSAQKGFLVSVPDTYHFSYNLNPEALSLTGANAQVFCYSCLYDLEITISDDCNNQQFGGQPLVKTLRNFSLNAIDTGCQTPSLALNFDQYLGTGSYLVTKKLTISKDALAYYRDTLYPAYQTIRTLNEFVQEQRTILASAGACKPTCETCQAGLGSWEEYRNNYLTGAGILPEDSASFHDQIQQAYQQALQECAELCGNLGAHVEMRKSMLLDMTPSSGQYANLDDIKDKYNIFYTESKDAQDNEDPATYATVTNYTDINGQPALVQGDGGQTPVSPAQLEKEEFAAKFQLSWAEALLPFHPEYCKLQKFEALAASHLWDVRFGKVETYAEAKAKGYLNPIHLSSYSQFDATGTADYDPIAVQFGSESTYYTNKLSTLLQQFKSITLGGTSRTVTLWNMATIVNKCSADGNEGACYLRYISIDSAFAASSCTADLDFAWRSFRQMYLDNKQAFIKERINQLCTSSPTPATLIAAGYQSYFASSDDLFANNDIDLPTNKTEADNLKNSKAGVEAEYYTSTCQSYASLWWDQLAPCNLTEADKAILLPQLVDVCSKGADAAHPTGSSTVKPGTVATYSSFEQVLEAYLASKGIPKGDLCNPYLINFPKPYNRPAEHIDQLVVTRPDSCSCDRISNLYAAYQLNSKGNNSFSLYLKNVYKTSIADTTLYQLLGLCYVISDNSCNHVLQPISLPPLLQCGGESVCVNCDSFAIVHNRFLAKFPGKVPVWDSLATTSSQKEVNQLYVNYMNSQIGAYHSLGEYLAFRNQCGIRESQYSCDSLSSYLENYEKQFNTQNKMLVRVASQELEYYENYEDIVRDGAIMLPDTVRQRSGQWYNNMHFLQQGGGKFCWQNGYAYEARMRYMDVPFIDDVFYLHTGDSANVFERWENSLTLFGTTYQPGLYLRVKDSFYLASKDPDIVRNWFTVKIWVRPDSVKIYVDGNLIFNHSRDTAAHITNGSAVNFGLRGRHWSIDYLKLYDASDSIRYFEDFNNVKKPAVVDYNYFCPSVTGNYRSNFATYFNQLKGTSYSLVQIDSIYNNGCGIGINLPGDTAGITSGRLYQVLKQYQKQFITSDSGYVDLDMKTFAGNKTLDEGPKGVFDVNGKLIGNTIDGTNTQIKQSYVSIWNSSPVNQQIGTLSLLGNSRFRLTLNPGRQAPCNGIIGMRYFQFDVKATDSLGNFDAGLGSFIDWGDSTHVMLKPSNNSTPNTLVGDGKNTNYYYEQTNIVGKDYPLYDLFRIRHYYPHTDTLKKYTVTVYHTDLKGAAQFYENPGFPALASLSNLRGYFPENMYRLSFYGTSDSTLNRTSQIKNWDKIISLTSVELEAINGSPFLHNNLGSFARNHNLRRLRITPCYYFYPGYGAADTIPISIVGNPLYQTFPDINRNFPELRFLYFDIWRGRAMDLSSFNFTLPKVKIIHIAGQKPPIGLVDSMYNQLVRVNTVDSGMFLYGYDAGSISAQPTSISEGPRNYLLSKNWVVYDGTYSSGFIYPQSAEDLYANDTLPLIDPFTEYFNLIFHTNFSKSGLDSFYLRKTNKIPSVCELKQAIYPDYMLCGSTEAVFTQMLPDSIDNCSDNESFAVTKGTEYFRYYKDSLANNFDSLYLAKCLNAYRFEDFTVTHSVREYHHTLYYYDQAGNLLKTVPPAGVAAVYRSTWSDSVNMARSNHQVLVPDHFLVTQYRYNTLNQVVAQNSPDGGLSQFWYDRLGRLAISQNAVQKAAAGAELNRKYSYTQYDALGRITEVGEITNASSTPVTDALTKVPDDLAGWLSGSAANKAQITTTVYDLPYPGFTVDPPISQHNLRNRVSYVSFTPGNNPAQFNAASFYSYDLHGNVDTLLQDYGNSSVATPNMMNQTGNRWKKLTYQYDLISGKVNQVNYNPGQADQFFHRYAYDAENRLIRVETSSDGWSWDADAQYEYYAHGPLSRMLLGQDQVQGIDYAYTLQGWLKGVNSTSLYNGQFDMGRDGLSTSDNKWVARDAIGFGLSYFSGDYNAIKTTETPFAGFSAGLPSGQYRPLYNGNISSMAVNIGKFTPPALYNYTYDQLNRLTAMDMFTGFTASTNTWSSTLTQEQAYKERVRYDANGNILGYLRNGQASKLAMDSLTYEYPLDGSGRMVKNQLLRIRDNVNSAEYAEDLNDQGANNYGYDAIGNLISDASEGITNISWTVYGKISQITKNNGTIIRYSYDAAGNRISKAVQHGTASTDYTWYVRDAQGNVLSTYTAKGDGSTLPADVFQTEVNLYGSSRIGILNRKVPVTGSYTPPTQFSTYRGLKFFELSNHLGNVLATISDRKKGVSSNGVDIDYYEADVQTASDYYPFGMLMPGRQFGMGLNIAGGTVTGTSEVNGYTVPVDLSVNSRTGTSPSEYVASSSVELADGFETSTADELTVYIADGAYAGTGNVGGSGLEGSGGKYRYGFNGKENDNEVKGVGNEQDYGMRIYNPRIGKFLSVDPLIKQYPELTPYQFGSNKPISAIDLDGLEAWDLSTPLVNLKQRPIIDNIQAKASQGTISSWNGEPNFWGKAKAGIEQMRLYNPSAAMASQVLYGVIDDAYITYTGLKYGHSYARKLDGEHGLSYKDRIGANLNTLSLAFGGVQAAGERALLTQGIGAQGALGEDVFGRNLNEISNNFPVFDNFSDGVATSAKTLDLNSPSYIKNPKAITSTLNRYINKIADFEAASRKGFTLESSMIDTRELGVLTIGSATRAQTAAIKASMEFAVSKTVKFTLKSTSYTRFSDAFNKMILAVPKPRNK